MMKMRRHADRLATCALAALACSAATAAEWPISLGTVNGMTPSQQLTNAVVQASVAGLKMAGDKAAQLGVDKYSLRAESPVLGMGDASMFAASDTDLAGNLRLRDGRLDPGCFQCWLNILGTYLIMR